MAGLCHTFGHWAMTAQSELLHVLVFPQEDDGGIKLNVKKSCLYFVLNLCKVFEQTVLALESDAVSVCDVYPAVAALRNKLKDRLTDHRFGFEASTLLESEDIPENITRKTESNFCDAQQ
jgi:hypothetical protein